eukprot:665414-Pelagomonas_calceolata.AAC.1
MPFSFVHAFLCVLLRGPAHLFSGFPSPHKTFWPIQQAEQPNYLAKGEMLGTRQRKAGGGESKPAGAWQTTQTLQLPVGAPTKSACCRMAQHCHLPTGKWLWSWDAESLLAALNSQPDTVT